MFADAPDDDIVVDASDLSFRPAPSIDASRASFRGPSVDCGRSLQYSSLGVRLGHNYLQDRPGARKSSGRDPPRHLRVATSLAASEWRAHSANTRGAPRFPDYRFGSSGSGRSLRSQVRPIDSACSSQVASDSRIPRMLTDLFQDGEITGELLARLPIADGRSELVAGHLIPLAGRPVNNAAALPQLCAQAGLSPRGWHFLAGSPGPRP